MIRKNVLVLTFKVMRKSALFKKESALFARPKIVFQLNL